MYELITLLKSNEPVTRDKVIEFVEEFFPANNFEYHDVLLYPAPMKIEIQGNREYGVLFDNFDSLLKAMFYLGWVESDDPLNSKIEPLIGESDFKISTLGTRYVLH